MQEIRPEELEDNPFSLIRDDWMLITAEKDARVNMMTASWGGLGIIWNKPVATVYIRESRFTKEFVDGSGRFSLCVLPEAYRKTLQYCGSASGRDGDKVRAAGLTVEHLDSTPYFSQARLVMVCRTLFSQQLLEANFLDAEIFSRLYPTRDLHTMYIAEIERVLTRPSAAAQ
ncbi:MAG: flavin reductase family protein [Treponemataceae bacterium]|nr:flavin reductase family protein [Treponemataceae bacterium]